MPSGNSSTPAETPILPCSVNFTALLSRLPSTCPIRTGSPRNTPSQLAEMNVSNRSPLASARVRAASHVLRSVSSSSNGRTSNWISSPSRRENSTRSSITRSSVRPDVEISRTISPCRSSSGVRASTSETASTPFSGVRISWLMLDRKSDFAAAATSARCSASIAFSSICLRAVMSWITAKARAGEPFTVLRMRIDAACQISRPSANSTRYSAVYGAPPARCARHLLPIISRSAWWIAASPPVSESKVGRLREEMLPVALEIRLAHLEIELPDHHLGDRHAEGQALLRGLDLVLRPHELGDVLVHRDQAADLAIAVIPRRGRPFQPALAAIGARIRIAVMAHRLATQHLPVHRAPLLRQPGQNVVDVAAENVFLGQLVLGDPARAGHHDAHFLVAHRDRHRRGLHETAHGGIGIQRRLQRRVAVRLVDDHAMHGLNLPARIDRCRASNADQARRAIGAAHAERVLDRLALVEGLARRIHGSRTVFGHGSSRRDQSSPAAAPPDRDRECAKRPSCIAA